jgi:hypothetical protein
MSFPASPTNGQQITLAGVLYQYDSTLTVWKRMARTYSLNANNTSFSNLTISGTVVSNGFFWSNGSPYVGSITVNNFTGDGTTTAFTLSISPTVINNVLISYNGLLLNRSSYSIAGSTLTFGTAPAAGSSIEVTVIESAGVGYTASNISIRAQSMTLGILLGG